MLYKAIRQCSNICGPLVVLFLLSVLALFLWLYRSSQNILRCVFRLTQFLLFERVAFFCISTLLEDGRSSSDFSFMWGIYFFLLLQNHSTMFELQSLSHDFSVIWGGNLCFYINSPQGPNAFSPQVIRCVPWDFGFCRLSLHFSKKNGHSITHIPEDKYEFT